MTASVFYSVSPFGTGDIKVASNIVISGGVATLTAQTGNIGAGCCVEYDSLKAYIAPNRIGFDSGSVEIKPGYKYTDATSGATGIVRAVEVTGGTWGGGDAAGWIYFESTIGAFGNNNVLNQTKPTVSNDVATIDGTIQGNIGNGNTQFVVKTAIGGASSDQTSVAVTSIHHEYASLSAFEAGFTDASHINNLSLVTADVVAHACCYYDHHDQTADENAASINFGTTDATHYLQIYTPTGGAESINSQRHSGKFDANKYLITHTVAAVTCNISEDYTVFIGIQFRHAAVGNESQVLRGGGLNAVIDSCIINRTGGNGSAIMELTNLKLFNSIVYGNIINGIYDGWSNRAYKIYNCTFTNGTSVGINCPGGGDTVVKNCAVFNTNNDFSGTFTVTYSASDDTQAGTGNIDWNNGATDWANVFTDYANGDFSLKNYTTVGIAIIDQGTPLFSEGIWRDINGDERGASWDIGADEYVAAGGFSMPVMMHHYNQIRLG